MTPRECVITALDHQKPEILPYQLYMDPAVRDAVDREMGGRRWRDSLIPFFHETWFVYPNRETRPDGRYVDAFGSLWESGSIMHHLQPAMPEPSFKGFQWPNLDTIWDQQQPKLAEAISLNPNSYHWAAFGFGLFERAWTLRGFNEILMDLAGEPAFCEDLFDQIMEHQMKLVGLLLTLDIDAIFFSDDWAYQKGLIMGPELWRQMIKPRKARMIEQVHRAGKKAILHCCGSVMEVLPEIVEIKLDCLQSLQPEAMDVFEIKRRHGDSLALWGGGPSQSLIPFGTPAEIRAAFARLRHELGAGGGYICAPSKPLLSETPVANAVAAIEGTIGHPLPRG
jgi:uroporphyrinogen decarboxylase